MIASDEIMRVEEFKIGRFMALGLGRYEAIRAVEDGIDWLTVGARKDGLRGHRRPRNLALKDPPASSARNQSQTCPRLSAR
jgi:hypothetical protein